MVTGNQILPPLLPRACCVLLLLLWFLFDFCRLSLCQRLAWGKPWGLLRVWPVSFPVHVPYIFRCFWNVLVLTVWLPKRTQREQWREEIQGSGPLSPLEVSGGRDLQQCGQVQQQWLLPFCLHLYDQKQRPMMRTQILCIWRTGSFLATLAPVSSSSNNVQSCLSGGGGKDR